jgi:hypothetical protein
MVGIQRAGTPRHSGGRARGRRYFAVAHAREAAFRRQRCAVSGSAKRRPAGAANRHGRSLVAAVWFGGCRYAHGPAGCDVANTAPTRPLRSIASGAGQLDRRQAGDRNAAGKDAGPARPFRCSPGGCHIEHGTARDTPTATRALETRSRQCEIADRDATA